MQWSTLDKVVSDLIHLSPFTIFSRAYALIRRPGESKPRESRRARLYGSVVGDHSKSTLSPYTPQSRRFPRDSAISIGRGFLPPLFLPFPPSVSPVGPACSMTPNRTICQCRTQRLSRRRLHDRIYTHAHTHVAYVQTYICALRGETSHHDYLSRP